MVDLPVWVISIIGLIGVITMIVLLSGIKREKNENSDIEKTLVIYAAVTAVLILLYGVACYIYFMSNIDYSTTFIICMSAVTTFLSVIAVAASTQQIVHS
jgi:uncharacterized protein with PQ loop repeat